MFLLLLEPISKILKKVIEYDNNSKTQTNRRFCYDSTAMTARILQYLNSVHPDSDI